jgi:hypothetical protein
MNFLLETAKSQYFFQLQNNIEFWDSLSGIVYSCVENRCFEDITCYQSRSYSGKFKAKLKGK